MDRKYMNSFNDFSDHDLTGLMGRGDQAAFTQLFKRYNRLLFIHAHKMLNDREMARDVVQEIFVYVWDNKESMASKSNFAGFLYSVIKNRILDILAHKKVELKYLLSIVESVERGEEKTDHLLRNNQLQLLIEKEIGYMPSKMREVFELSRKQHLTHKEIAVQLDLSEKTVRNQVNNALRILRARFEWFSILLFLILH
jgi:RNA polymerase sigma-70 factor (ECF subfamily)